MAVIYFRWTCGQCFSMFVPAMTTGHGIHQMAAGAVSVCWVANKYMSGAFHTQTVTMELITTDQYPLKTVLVTGMILNVTLALLLMRTLRSV